MDQGNDSGDDGMSERLRLMDLRESDRFRFVHGKHAGQLCTRSEALGIYTLYWVGDHAHYSERFYGDSRDEVCRVPKTG